MRCLAASLREGASLQPTPRHQCGLLFLQSWADATQSLNLIVHQPHLAFIIILRFACFLVSCMLLHDFQLLSLTIAPGMLNQEKSNLLLVPVQLGLFYIQRWN